MRRIALLAAVVLLSKNCLVNGAVGQSPDATKPGRVGVAQTTIPQTTWPPIQSSNLVVLEGETISVRAGLARTMAPWLARKQFEELDEMAGELRASKAQTAIGMWHLLIFYDQLCDLLDNGSEKECGMRLEFLQQWVSAQPKSITARVALARAYKYYAWHARGYGFANTVTDARERLFEERLVPAARVLREARQLEAKCPVWWDTMHFVALGLGWPLATYNRMFEEAVAFEPNYTFFYNNKVVFLLPRWFGQEGDWQRFASESADKIGHEAGDILYARIGWRVHQRRFYDAFLRDGGDSWRRMEKGMAAIVKNCPDSLTAASELAYLSYQAGDAAVAKPLFERIGNKLDKEVWDDDEGKFLRGRAWATGANPIK